MGAIMKTRITPNAEEPAYKKELREIRNSGSGRESIERTLSYLEQLTDRAKTLQDGYIMKIVWDDAGGYPQHAWGFIQYTVRPYIQGYGCDGTTDLNIHLIAATLCKRLGIDYTKAYTKAYPEDQYCEWVDEMMSDADLKAQTVIPDGVGEEVLMLALSDLYQINNRSLVGVLEVMFEACGQAVANWWKHEDRLRHIVSTV